MLNLNDGYLTSPARPPHVSDADVEASTDLRGVTDELAVALIDVSQATASTTVRVRAHSRGSDASAMAAIYPRRRVGGGKLYMNGTEGRSFLIALFDAVDGRLLATFDGEVITAERTAAATALGIRRMACSGSRTAALFGTGVQAAWQALAIAQETELDDLRIVGRSANRVTELVTWCRGRGIPARRVDAFEAVVGADVVVTATSSYDPLFDGDWLSDGTLVCGVGSTKAARRELDVRTVARAGIVVTDSIEGARWEAGDLIGAAEAGCFDWSQLVGIEHLLADDAITMPTHGIRLFESQGVAIEDVVGAWHAYHRLGMSAG
jgi:ornithine cyclodeaminase/alanine dehydrogenase-like protein (mu-crystallin family)